jgi:hypothetical protein
MITAKVICYRKDVTSQSDLRGATVHFSPDYADGRNQEWAQATPSLSLTMTLNGDAAELFEQNKCYELRFVEDAE